MPDFQKRCELLEKENEALRDRVFQLEELLGLAFEAPSWLGLTGQEASLFGLLLAREHMTKSAAMDCLYGLAAEGEIAEEKIIDVFVHKIRRKLEPHEIKIETKWGQGYFMTPDMKTKARALIEQHKGVAA